MVPTETRLLRDETGQCMFRRWNDDYKICEVRLIAELSILFHTSYNVCGCLVEYEALLHSVLSDKLSPLLLYRDCATLFHTSNTFWLTKHRKQSVFRNRSTHSMPRLNYDRWCHIGPMYIDIFLSFVLAPASLDARSNLDVDVAPGASGCSGIVYHFHSVVYE